MQNSRRHNTLHWKLKDLEVCKVFFLATIGYANDEAVQSVLKSNRKTNNESPSVSAAPDPRGHHAPKHAFSEGYEDTVMEFIEKYRPQKSHYNVEHAPNRRYLPVNTTFSNMHKEYLKHCIENNMRKCSWTYFHNICQKMNLSTAMPSQDSCDTCRKHAANHPESANNSHDCKSCSSCDCDVCANYPEHIKNKNMSRQHLHQIEALCENDSDKAVFTADMKK